MIMPNLSETSGADAAILDRVILPGNGKLSAPLARYILSMKFSTDDVETINRLSGKAREGTLTPKEEAELDSYLRVGHFMSVMKSKARMAIKRLNRSSS
jgi:hypothetical protein